MSWIQDTLETRSRSWTSVIKRRNEISEYIGGFKLTQGTETSQYLEERTSTETPLVVASESGLGQWRLLGQPERFGTIGHSGGQPRTDNALSRPRGRRETWNTLCTSGGHTPRPRT